ncbi:ATP citrate synthase [Plasmodiophora brassicae]|uniref:ATP citrate synthase n=1 Tax=Plasmodiophora brassicae TaxID=37360 RepID=A0A3P3Y6S3_PLABS|nr:unnamed protein product [Plasmodiophora brassicae]
MSQKAIREYDGKRMLANWMAMNSEDDGDAHPVELVHVGPETDLESLPELYPWLTTKRLVAKPDQLIKRRGKANLLKLNATWDEAKQWVMERRDKVVQVEVVAGKLTHFLIEPFVPHSQEDEYYLCITTERSCDVILFHHEGGVDVGDVDAKAVRLEVTVGTNPTQDEIRETLLQSIPVHRQAFLCDYIEGIYQFFTKYQFAYLEINPLVMTSNPARISALDLAAKLDETARHECHKMWGEIEFPPAFGRTLSADEEYIDSLDAKTGASLKLTILNEQGRLWLMVAGGGASVIYADTISDFGMGHELANYGEYSGAPTESLTYEYARTILRLMTKAPHPDGKILIIGGGIANFTNVAETFKGIIRAIKEYAPVLKSQNVTIWVRRAGPNYQDGLKRMKDLGTSLSLPIEVFGPETHLTSIIAMAFKRPVASLDFHDEGLRSPHPCRDVTFLDTVEVSEAEKAASLFTRSTTSIVYGMQAKAVQNMLDFDYICGRSVPSVSAIVYTFSANHYRKFYWGSKEIMLPVYQNMSEALRKFPQVDVCVNFASSRSVFDSTKEMIGSGQLNVIAVIAEGVPEKRTRQLIQLAKAKGVMLIGPATVGGIKPGCFRIGNTGGMLDNILASKLYRPGSVAYVSRSGGLSNELNNIIARTTDGVYEGVAIGGDRYPATTFLDHILRYENNPEVKMIVLLGEVGGTLEHDVCEALSRGRITKPLVAWCTGTCADVFPYEVQFGHAGALANAQAETAAAKNAALLAAGAIVPSNFEEFASVIHATYKDLVTSGALVPRGEIEPPKVPLDYDWARKLGLIRRPAAFVSSITDERGEELSYAGMKISKVFEESMGIGGVLGLLWFRRRLPDYACRFIEMVLMVTADHGPAVSGAHNTIVTARAGKDLISSLCSGLLTIGPRFGGALDGAAASFSAAYDAGLSPQDFVDEMRRKNQLIMGIGHKIKSLENPDQRVVIVKKYAEQHFPSTALLDYALAVEQVTTKKKSNLILNVDGCIGVAFVDLLRSCGLFTKAEADEYVQMGTLNGLFVLGRSIGFIGHFLDQTRLKQDLYRHDTDDISYITDVDIN